MDASTRCFGKYRAVCTNNVDPMGLARIQVVVPDVYGDAPSPWAMPCVPIAGMKCGVFAVPRVDADVWVEFERGDPDYPVWVGGFWNSGGEVPALSFLAANDVDSVTITTQQQNRIAVSDLPGPNGGILLTSASGAQLIVNDTGIYLQNGRGATITLVGPTVSVNDGALTVT